VPPTPALRRRFDLPRPVDLRETLAGTQLGPFDPCLRLSPREAWRATRTPHGPAAERLRVERGRELDVEAWGPGAEWLLDHAPALCGAGDDAATFQPAHPRLKRLHHLHPGLRIGRTDAVFEAALTSVLQQRIMTRDAWRSWHGLVRGLAPEAAPGPLPDLWLPPSPERVAQAPYHVFHRFGIERRRADVMRRVACVAPRLEEATTDLSLEAAGGRLASVPGVGPWTRARVVLHALGDADAVCLGDLHLPHLVAWALAGEPRADDQRMLELLEPFRGHRARVQRLLLLASFRG
jgi:3-methyladenine DNA glycosylase/8-oxoguanine DNA glycosylase